MPPGRFSQDSFLKTDPTVGVRMFLLRILCGMFPPCYLLALNDVGLRRDKTFKEGQVIWPWTSYWTTLCFITCSVLLWGHWDHARKCFSWLLTQSRCSINLNFKISLLGRIRDLLPGDEKQEGLPFGQARKFILCSWGFQVELFHSPS